MHFHERIFEAAGEDAADRVPEGLGVAFEGSTLFLNAAAQSEEEAALRRAQVGTENVWFTVP